MMMMLGQFWTSFSLENLRRGYALELFSALHVETHRWVFSVGVVRRYMYVCKCMYYLIQRAIGDLHADSIGFMLRAFMWSSSLVIEQII